MKPPWDLTATWRPPRPRNPIPTTYYSEMSVFCLHPFPFSAETNYTRFSSPFFGGGEMTFPPPTLLFPPPPQIFHASLFSDGKRSEYPASSISIFRINNFLYYLKIEVKTNSCHDIIQLYLGWKHTSIPKILDFASMTVWLGKLSSYRRANRRNASSKREREREREASSLLLLLLGARNMKDFLRKRGKPLVLHARIWKSEIYSRLNAFIFAQKLCRFLSFLSASQGKEQDVSLFSQGGNSAQNIFEGIDEASIPVRKRNIN